MEKNHAVTSCQVYDKEYETTSIPEPKNVNQDERTRLDELRETSENTPDIMLDLVEYIKERSKEQQQQILSTDNRKNQKLSDVPIKNKQDTVTESSLVTLEMKDSSQQLETSTIKLTKFRSNKNEGSFLSTNEELQVDTSFTQGNLETNIKNANTKDKGNQLQKQLFQKGKWKEHSTNTTTDRDNLVFCLACDKPGD